MSISKAPLEKSEQTVEIQASASTDSVDVVQTIETPEDETKKREQALADRALKRLKRREKKHALAEDLSKTGDELLEKQDYVAACASYLDATNLWTSNSSYYLKLTVAYLKCELYVEAAHAATRALSFDPKSLEARYRRGVARLEQRLLPAAKTDFEAVLKRDPKHADAQTSLATLLKLQEASSKLGTHELSDPPSGETAHQEVDFGFPHYDDERLELASLSDSSDCNHVGNGIACRFYNHQGCARGNECTFSHAPDEKSVRDNVGKNICLYYLLSSCKFGDLKCIYAHTKKDLPTTQGWWNDDAQIAKVKSVLEMAEKQAKEQRALDMLLYKLEASKARKAKVAKKKSGAQGIAGKREPTVPKTAGHDTDQSNRRSKPSLKSGAKQNYNDFDSDSEEMQERMRNGGFTDYQLNELLSQGVKPWDDDAHDVLAALSY